MILSGEKIEVLFLPYKLTNVIFFIVFIQRNERTEIETYQRSLWIEKFRPHCGKTNVSKQPFKLELA